jgi:hypothetical protein
MPDALSDAKAALAHANKAFPSSTAPKAPSTAPAPRAPSNLGTELAEKGKMMNNARMALNDTPKMHKGGTVKADGNYNLKAGEHVLTAPEAAKARSHALMASGMKSLAKPAGKPTTSMTIEAAPNTSFTDKNLDPKMSPAGANKITSAPAPSGGSISPMPNAPRQLKSTQGTTKVSDISKT